MHTPKLWCPTLVLLWTHPLLPEVEVPEEVPAKVIAGHNLMWADLKTPPPHNIPNQALVALVVAGNPLAFAVGQFRSTNMNGVCVEILHSHGDGLSQLFLRTPAGFTQANVLPLAAELEDAETDSGKSDNSCEAVCLTDEAVLHILLTVLAVAVTDAMLPLDPGKVLQLMHRCKRSLPFDIRATSFHRVGHLLEHAHKLGVLTYKVPPLANNKQVTEVFRSHEAFQGFRPLVRKPSMRKSVDYLPSPSVHYSPVLVPSGKTRVFIQKYFSIEAEYFKPNELPQLMGAMCYCSNSKKHEHFFNSKLNKHYNSRYELLLCVRGK